MSAHSELRRALLVEQFAHPVRGRVTAPPKVEGDAPWQRLALLRAEVRAADATDVDRHRERRGRA